MSADGVSLGSINVVYNEMSEADRENALEIATNALKLQDKSEKQLYHKDIAQYIKQELDSQRGGTFNVIVGQSFGSFVSHETKSITHFFIGNVGFLIWKHG